MLSAKKTADLCRVIAFLAVCSLVPGCSRPGGSKSPDSPTTGPSTQPTATLTITVTDLRNHKGQLIFGVFTSADGFPKDSKKSVNWQIKPADANSITFTATLPPGRYGASVLHDENKNNQMDVNMLGLPEEGYGVTNNPKPKLRSARFDESQFDLPPEGKTLTISLQYF